MRFELIIKWNKSNTDAGRRLGPYHRGCQKQVWRSGTVALKNVLDIDNNDSYDVRLSISDLNGVFRVLEGRGGLQDLGA